MLTSENVLLVLQIIVGLGLINVWIVRFNKKTAYRGGDATSMSEEFAVYGLPRWCLFFVGALKLGVACCLLAGIVMPQLVVPAAAVLVVLMLGALVMHAKVKDPLSRSIPALLMLIMSAAILYLKTSVVISPL